MERLSGERTQRKIKANFNCPTAPLRLLSAEGRSHFGETQNLTEKVSGPVVGLIREIVFLHYQDLDKGPGELAV